jgi:5-methylcytosine-specific restriction protein B
MTINYEKLDKIISSYKENFKKLNEQEIYKWRAVKHFQDNWNINADNFSEMLEESLEKSDNLLTSRFFYPKKMIIEFAKLDEEFIRTMFKDLFDESITIYDRIENFKSQADVILEKYEDSKKLNHYQTYNTISIYLFFRYPEKYFIYKYKKFKNFSRNIEYKSEKINGKSNRVTRYFQLCKEVLDYLKKDNQLLDMSRSRLGKSEHKDENYHILVEDIIYYGSKYNFKTEEWWPKLEEYDPNISTEKWKELLNDNDVFTKSSLEIMKRLYDYGGKATCSELSNKYGEHFNFYNSGSINLAKRVEQKTNCPVIKDENEKLRWWPILYTGKNTEDKDRGTFIWKMRPELKEAIDEKDLFKINLYPPVNKIDKYTKEDFLKEVFIDEYEYDSLVSLLKNKMNIIIQGAPGVGKTFAAKRLAYSIMEEKDDERIKVIQFHQNYSYEDFIMGYKPNEEGFELQKGVFYEFCKEAEKDIDREYFFIIDEINRGNLSKVFGELLMLIENQYRGEKMSLAYDGSHFSVPKNLYVIGMMNTADRSLAMIDYALRRRFSFFNMTPSFDNDKFVYYQKELDNEIFDDLIKEIKELNTVISKDPSLGDGFCIGHSYFCDGKDREFNDGQWFREVIDYEIIPILNEYWFDEKSKVDEWSRRLRGVLND